MIHIVIPIRPNPHPPPPLKYMQYIPSSTITDNNNSSSKIIAKYIYIKKSASHDIIYRSPQQRRRRGRPAPQPRAHGRTPRWRATLPPWASLAPGALPSGTRARSPATVEFPTSYSSAASPPLPYPISSRTLVAFYLIVPRVYRRATAARVFSGGRCSARAPRQL